MNVKLAQLAHRTTAASYFRWVPGMRYLTGNRRGYGRVGDEHSADFLAALSRTGALPDLADPATVGGLLALVREKHNDDRLVCLPPLDDGPDDRWRVGSPRTIGCVGRTECAGDSEAAALECAP